MNAASVFNYLRALQPDNRLTLDQVKAGDKIIAAVGIDVFAALVGYKEREAGVSGQYDISEVGYDLIKEREGYSSKAYQDSGGVWTIGYGTIKYPNGQRVRQGDTTTVAQATTYLKNDTKWVDRALDDLVEVDYNQQQHDALASFVYNVGRTAFSTSTLLRLLNRNEKSLAADELEKWVFVGKKYIKGLANRRAIEKKLFLS